jgi:hypothetical protein
MRSAILEQLSGIFPTKADSKKRLAELTEREAKTARLVRLINHGDWPAMEAILTSFYTEAINEFSIKDLSPDDMKRLNNRMELLRNIKEKIQKAVADHARVIEELQTLKEQTDVRRTESAD